MASEYIEKIGKQNIVIGVLTVVTVYVLYRSLYVTENSLSKMSLSNDEMFEKMKVLMDENKLLKDQLNQINTSRQMNIVKSLFRKTPYINIVHRRPLRGIGGLNPATITSTSEAAAMSNPLGDWIYGPFSLYGMYPDPASGAKRKWRLYAVYTDNSARKDSSVPSGTFVINIKTQNYHQAPTNQMFDMKFIFYTTCGGVANTTRDFNSNMLELPNPLPSAPADKIDSRPGHGIMYAWIEGSNTGTSASCGASASPVAQLYYLELQCLDVYE